MMNVLPGIARLAIAAPRRVIAIALLVMVGAGLVSRLQASPDSEHTGQRTTASPNPQR